MWNANLNNGLSNSNWNYAARISVIVVCAISSPRRGLREDLSGMLKMDKPAAGAGQLVSPPSMTEVWHGRSLVVHPNGFERRKKRGENVKTYCKRLKLDDADLIEKSITAYLHDKWRKNSTQKFLANLTGRDKEYVAEHGRPGDAFFAETVRKISVDMARHVRNRTVKEHIYSHAFGLPVIRYRKIRDGGSGKERVLGLETVLFRLYEAVAQKAGEPLFNSKLGKFQVASIKGRGQMYGKKAIIKWMTQDPDGTKYEVKADVKQCYPSIPHGQLAGLFRRDLKKSPDLLYLLLTFLEIYEEWPNPDAEDVTKGILVGSPVSKDMCNYYLSYAYHYAERELRKSRTRRGKTVSVALFDHQIYYMDDLILYGRNKRDVEKAMKMIIAFFEKFLLLKIKANWRKFRAMYRDAEGKLRGAFTDYMGMRFHGGAVHTKNYYGREVRYREAWTTVRRRIFLKARRQLARFEKMVKRRVEVHIKFAKSLVSQYGWFKNTEMAAYRKKHKVDKIIRIARNMISDNAREIEYKVQNYFNQWRCSCA